MTTRRSASPTTWWKPASPPVSASARRSVYRWQGAVEQAVEVPLAIKTTADRYDALEQALCTAHPYELPEIIALPVERGLEGYLRWMAEMTADTPTE